MIAAQMQITTHDHDRDPGVVCRRLPTYVGVGATIRRYRGFFIGIGYARRKMERVSVDHDQQHGMK